MSTHEDYGFVLVTPSWFKVYIGVSCIFEVLPVGAGDVGCAMACF